MKKQAHVIAGGFVTTLLLIGAGCSAYNTSNTNTAATNGASINPYATNVNTATENQNDTVNVNAVMTNENTTTGTNSTNSTTGNTSTVTIQNFAFVPADLVVKAGTTATWTNADSVAHTIVGNTGGPSSDTIGAQGTYRYTFSTPGTYTYHCSLHPTMIGSVTVTQ